MQKIISNNSKSFCMFVSQNHFRRNSKINFNDKASATVIGSEKTVTPFLKWFCKPKAEVAYIFFKMQNKKKCVANGIDASVTTNKIINEFLSYDDVTNVKNSLNKFFLEWVQSDLDYTKKERELLVFHYQSLVLLLDALLLFKLEKTAKNLTN